jgi:predicted nucleic acid-binding protein
VIVVDASAWATSLVRADALGDATRGLLADDDWAAPSHTVLEVMRTLWKWEQAEILDSRAASALVAEAVSTSVRFQAPGPDLLAWVWRTRDNLSVYDAPYVHLAAQLEVTLVTMDRRLARAARALGVRAVVPEETC